MSRFFEWLRSFQRRPCANPNLTLDGNGRVVEMRDTEGRYAFTAPRRSDRPTYSGSSQ